MRFSCGNAAREAKLSRIANRTLLYSQKERSIDREVGMLTTKPSRRHLAQSTAKRSLFWASKGSVR
ncbi:hypothetical protein [Argonema galeatum]|uniref:hypothetical protein n=1 Tax=Argonema galeatum TaxID=2942762 RepID=UPI002012C4BE|nr:hypothetical protein [Argonema galeatum]MCL1466483.1 hypothetical protein [Argonema galeatum A003/A1]